ncbi:MBL fold metallo-hydrolase [Tumidithrix elongata RA019]|uniref:MBL fold metallo-hydrolase n=1 Tax=Tumidithrix elongata BACA0141 TaxID=2716417 RepID=A0AAW9Q4S6_9CYAN|nr:MBL fold metallo-hydrolase [Tumidithrix elongata RA019]
MAQLSQKRSQNVEGDFYVDSTCIDCDTCRWMAPEIFYAVDGQSAVQHQPIQPNQRLLAMQALLACPTASIGTVEKPTDIKVAQESFPIPIAENIYHCGFHSEKSFGAASYLIQRPEGNILIDSPRFNPPLVKQLEAMGGVRYLYLTHRDDVADHQKFHDHFGCDRLLHTDEITSGTSSVEIQFSGIEPIQLAPDLLIIPTPGHTKGHTVLLYRDRFLFTGDHLAWSNNLNQLIGFRNACWYSWPETTKSMRMLMDYSFEWILPGHGRRFHTDLDTMKQEMQKCVTWMEAH